MPTTPPELQFYVHTLSSLYARRAQSQAILMAREFCLAAQLPERLIVPAKEFWQAIEARLEDNFFMVAAIYTKQTSTVLGAHLTGTKQIGTHCGQLPTALLSTVLMNYELTGNYYPIVLKHLERRFFDETLADQRYEIGPVDAVQIWCQKADATQPTCYRWIGHQYVATNVRP